MKARRSLLDCLVKNQVLIENEWGEEQTNTLSNGAWG